ncbi:MAG: hypothetical protein FWD49_00335 [Firmicutes bacterium]|nr:hypothetical protein [Bacillota bacterium]
MPFIYRDFIKSLHSISVPKIIGKTVLNFPIPMLSYAPAPCARRVLIVGAVHAREFITAPLALKLFKDYNKYGGSLSLHLVPMLNIDGVMLSRNGLNGVPICEKRKNFLREINKSSNFSLWKANINAVDINLNFNAGWGEGEGNLAYPAPSGFVGKCPESEPETRAVVRLMRHGNYDAVVAYHSKGEEVYYGFRSHEKHENKAKTFANYLGYTPKETPNSAGGLKDYFVQETNRLGLTVEVGSDLLPHPIEESELEPIYNAHKGSWDLLCNLLNEKHETINMKR